MEEISNSTLVNAKMSAPITAFQIQTPAKVRSLVCIAFLGCVSVGGAQETTPLTPPPIADPVDDAAPTLPKVGVEQTDPGQADLDDAVLKRIDAETNSQLEAVAELIEAALSKGLNQENQAFAKQMLGSIQLQRGEGLAGAMMQVRGRQQLKLRDEALIALEEAVAADPKLAEAHLLIARLNLISGGDIDAIRKSTSAAIELLADDPKQLSGAYLLRAVTQEKPKDKLADLDAAVAADPKNIDALRERGATKIQSGDVESAVADLQTVLSLDPTNQQIAGALVQQLVEMDRAEDAVAMLSNTIEAKPSEGLYRLRAILYRMLERDDDAFSDLNKAIAMQPKDPMALLQRAEIALSRDDVKSAKEDLRAANAISPEVQKADQAIVVRCFIAIAEGRTADAINDMKLLIERNPDDTMRQIQLANLYLQDKRPRKAIETLSDILSRNPKDASLLRSRGDAYLAVGEHAPAVKDYEAALAAADGGEADRSGILNNLAWVLATSPQEGVRDGKRSLELGLEAAKLTEESEPHILSTLAAGYAETGDFENAIKWSEKAVQLGTEQENEQLPQLQEELESYRRKEAWREKQETQENNAPLLAPEDLIDT